MPRIILLGAPGSGKGTQAAHLASSFDAPIIATGDIFRKNISEGTPLGIKAQAFMDKGELVPDEVVIDLVEDRFSQGDTENGWILDGFPRTPLQAVALDELLAKVGKKLDRCFCINVPKDELIKRITGRLICPKCGAIYHEVTLPPQKAGICDVDGVELTRRPDDNIETAEHRIELYNEQTKQLIDHYKNEGLLTEIDGTKSLEEITDHIIKVLG